MNFIKEAWWWCALGIAVLGLLWYKTANACTLPIKTNHSVEVTNDSGWNGDKGTVVYKTDCEYIVKLTYGGEPAYIAFDKGEVKEIAE